MPEPPTPQPSRRVFLRRTAAFAAASAAVAIWPPAPARATPEAMQRAIRAVLGEAEARPGKVTLDIPALVENGNAVPISVKVESPMSAADHVREIAVFTERNPQLDVARFQLGPVNGRAEVATRIRLATSQNVVALARLSDGSLWQHAVDVLVTLAACIEG